MHTAGIVVAVSDTPAMRETLAILLEQECDLRFVTSTSAPLPELAVAEVALVALADPRPTLAHLARDWPHLPVVSVDLPGRSVAATGAQCRVPLEPHTIRSAVLERLSPVPESDLTGAIRLVVDTLRAELAYALRALRTFSTLHATSPGPDTHALLGAVMREQSHVLAECLQQMDRYCRRACPTANGADFLATLRAVVDRGDNAPGSRRVVCRWSGAVSGAPPGPIALAPLVAGYLLDHLRRGSAAAVVDGYEDANGLTVVYPPQRQASGARLPWALALADFALHPWGWRIVLGGTPTAVKVTVGLATA